MPAVVHPHSRIYTQARTRKCAHTHTTQKYVILIAFPRQQLFHKHASTLRYTHTACLVCSLYRNSANLSYKGSSQRLFGAPAMHWRKSTIRLSLRPFACNIATLNGEFSWGFILLISTKICLHFRIRLKWVKSKRPKSIYDIAPSQVFITETFFSVKYEMKLKKMLKI